MDKHYEDANDAMKTIVCNAENFDLNTQISIIVQHYLLLYWLDALMRSSRNERLSSSSTQTTFCVMFSLVLPTRPTAKKM